MSQSSAVASASFARSSPRCQPWSSLPRFPSGFSRLWSGPATKPSSEIDMWQMSGIGVLQVIAICERRHRTGRRPSATERLAAEEDLLFEEAARIRDEIKELRRDLDGLLAT